MDFMTGNNTNETGNTFVLDLTAVDENKVGGFECMPKGDYECLIDDCEFTESKNSGAPMMVFKYKVSEGEFEKRLLFHHCVLNKEFGIAMFKKVLVTAGLPADFNNFNPQEFADSGDAIGLPIVVNVGIQKYQDQKRNNVKDVKAAAVGGGFMGM